MSQRSYQGPALDETVQYLGEAPHWAAGEGETVDATDREDPGEERTENVPVPEVETPDVDGQSTLEDWGWSA